MNTFRTIITAVAFGLLCGFTDESLAADVTVFFSDVGSVGAGVELDNPILTDATVGDTDTLFIWVDPGNVVLDGFSLRARSTVPGVISFHEPILYNPDILWSKLGNADSGFDRWDGVGVNDWFGTLKTDDLTGHFNATGQFDGTAIDLDLDGSDSQGTLDPLYDVSAGYFLVGELSYDIIGLGATPLFLEIGEIGIINEGGHSSEVDVYFGDGEVVPSGSLNAWSQRLVPSLLPDATIVALPAGAGNAEGAVPEPSTWALALVTALTMALCRGGSRSPLHGATCSTHAISFSTARRPAAAEQWRSKVE